MSNPDVAVTDTHALIWHATGQGRKLGKRARRLFQRADAGRAAIYVPTIALVEFSEQVHRGVIGLGGQTFSGWAEALLTSGNYFEAPLTAGVVLAGEALYGIPERGDRLIAATALHMEAPLITRDPEIAETGGLDLVW